MFTDEVVNDRPTTAIQFRSRLNGTDVNGGDFSAPPWLSAQPREQVSAERILVDRDHGGAKPVLVQGGHSPPSNREYGLVGRQ